MKRVICATCLAFVCAVALSAQAQQGAAQQAADDQKKATPAAKPADSSVTVTGCLRAGDTPNSFVLATAKTADAPEAAAAPATPPADRPATPPANPANPPAQPPANPANPPAQPPANPGNPPVTPTAPPTAANPPANPDAAAAAPVGTSGAPEAAADVIRLIGAPADVNLQQHVGHTVKVTGNMTATAAKGRAMGRSLNISKIEHVSDTCK